MSNNVHNELLTRALEVLKILGGKIPDNYDVNQGHITLLGKTKSKNYMDIDNDIISMVFENNGHRYFWRGMFDEDGSYEEKLDIDYGCLTATFFTSPRVIHTSGFYLYNDIWGSPKIISDLDSVSIGWGDNKIVCPIDQYYDVFSTYMNSKKSSAHHLADNPDIIGTIVRMYETPIKKHVFDLKNNDQSWRFSKEKEKILSNYDTGVKECNQIYQNTIKGASDELNRNLQTCEEIKNGEMEALEELQKRYNSKKTRLISK